MKKRINQEIKNYLEGTSTKNLAIWFETTSNKAIISASNGDTPEDGDKISSWIEVNPQNMQKTTVAQATSGNQPTYMRDGINKLPVVRFGTGGLGSGGTGLSSSFTSLAPQLPISAFIVMKKTANESNSAAGIIIGTSGGWEIGCHRDDVTMLSLTSVDSAHSSDSANDCSADNIPKIFSYIAKYDGTNAGTYNYYKNGTELSYASSNTYGSSGKVTGTSTALVIGDGIAASDIGEIIVINRDISTEERQNIERYLSKKWGIKLQ